MLYGPDIILTNWQPAPAACGIYRQEIAIAKILLSEPVGEIQHLARSFTHAYLGEY